MCAALRRTLASRSALDGGGGGSWAAATGLSAGVSAWKTRCVAAAAEGATWGQCAQRSVRRLVTGRSTRCGAGAARRCRAARKEAGGGIPGKCGSGEVERAGTGAGREKPPRAARSPARYATFCFYSSRPWLASYIRLFGGGPSGHLYTCGTSAFVFLSVELLCDQTDSEV